MSTDTIPESLWGNLQVHVMHVVGARPNFIKVAPVVRALEERSFRQTLVHSGQHYDFNMSDVFFQQLGLPTPDVNLEVGSGTHARQTADVMVRLEPEMLERKPDLVIVYGDVNSTLAAALLCSKLSIAVAHVEAGLRAFDRSMPEEINRLLTDQVSTLLFTPSQDADQNLIREGIGKEKIRMVGNVMIDTLKRLLPMAKQHMPHGLPSRYILLTLHRPGNVNDEEFMREIFRTLAEVSRQIPVVFPIHPRTKAVFSRMNLGAILDHNFLLLDPLPYLSFIALQQGATAVVTDSGGIQEETTFLDVPCLTLRENTERPVTVTFGSNIVIGRKVSRLLEELEKILLGQIKKSTIPPLWDGRAADRIASELG